MKLSKFATLAKRDAVCSVFRIEDDFMWLGVAGAVYRAGGLPDIRGREQVQTVLSLTEKQMGKIFLRDFDCESAGDVNGYDLRDCALGEQDTNPLRMAAGIKGKLISAVRANDGELVFYDETYLAPLLDDIKNSDYMKLTVRVTRNGQRYIAVKNGFNILGVILPVRVVSDKYLANLQEFMALCAEQNMREKTRRAAAGQSQETGAGEQMTLETGNQTVLEDRGHDD